LRRSVSILSGEDHDAIEGAPVCDVMYRDNAITQRDSMTLYAGSCLCGTVTFEVEGRFDSFYLCHCKRCQKDTGSAHAANLFAQSAKLTWRSGADAVNSFTLPGTRHKRSFCRVCGSALPSTHIPDLVIVPAGSLDVEVPVPATAHIFTASKAAWERGSGSAAEFKGLPE